MSSHCSLIILLSRPAGISNPTDLVKTQMQKGGGASGGPFAVLSRVVRADGVRGLWVGTTPSMVRKERGRESRGAGRL